MSTTKAKTNTKAKLPQHDRPTDDQVYARGEAAERAKDSEAYGVFVGVCDRLIEDYQAQKVELGKDAGLRLRDLCSQVEAVEDVKAKFNAELSRVDNLRKQQAKDAK